MDTTFMRSRKESYEVLVRGGKDEPEKKGKGPLEQGHRGQLKNQSNRTAPK